jgi:hypothetical protein
MKIGIHQPQYWPWPGYFSKILDSDLFIFHQHVQYQKNSVINKNAIKGPNGEIKLVIPVKKGSSFQMIYDKETVNYDWIEKHKKIIKESYVKSLNFPRYYGEICQELDSYRGMKFVDILKNNVRFVCNLLEIDTPIVDSETSMLSGSELVLDQVLSSEGDIYITGTGGYAYLDIKKFETKEINIEFKQYKESTYNQVVFKCNSEFQSGLSMLDMLFNMDIESIRRDLDKNWVAK